ncbi:deoxyribose-phosphate aldolase [Streptococcus ictaluri]|uniref:Deoxyribose-phosphate aldolase n=1 Tax=Streptococcus ictaluri 707-05 TaxID=764299 RepID=G5K506_9STRE|nr:deoxyribose-phosphate aldolase [Streptococcus ictaluri]EHI68985.1 deoxyribose-phosphate aldolase [Streptococcus ictaluri 707-05]
MQLDHILKTVDHTLLTTTATWEEIKVILDDAMAYHTASACIPASYVKEAATYVEGKLPICTVIGFPNGYSTTASKVIETKDAIENGAAEIDMVINLTDVKNGHFDKIEDEIRHIKAACQDHILKVIVETCLLTEEELITLCGVVTRAGADFIKTSTGFSTAGATFKDVEIMAANIGEDVQIKAAGGISSLEDAEKFIELGASRLGTSRIIKLVKNEATEAGSY